MQLLRDRIRLLRALRPAGAGPVTLLSVLLVAGAVLPAATGVAMAVLVDRVEAGGAIGPPLALFGGVLLLGHVEEAFVEPLRHLVRARVDGAHRAALARLASASPTVAELEDPAVQDLVRMASAEATNWTEKTPGDGATAQLQTMARWVGAAGGGAVLVAYAWWLVPVVIVPAVAGRALVRRHALRMARLWARGLRAARRVGLWKDAVTSPAEGKELRVYGLAGWIADRQSHAIHVMFDPLWALGRRIWWVHVPSWLLMLVPLAAGYALVAAAVAGGRTTVAVETAVFAAGFAVFQAVRGTYDAMEIEQSLPVLDALPRVRAALDRPARPAAPRPAAVPAAPPAAVPAADDTGRPPRVELRGVRFAYPGGGRRVLDGLDLVIEPGELLAIVGLNGAGKSTLIKLLAGLYTPDAGTITADGVDIAALGEPAWRARLAVVFQDFVRYHLSAADNVALGRGGHPVDVAAMEAAADESGFRAVLDGLPDGWATPLARDRTGGVDLSGGQWQQLVLTRALYAVRTGARLLVLDEPTAHLDVRTERDVFARLTGRAGQISIVLISHRLATVRQADRIVLLDGGRITESGTHAQLMARDGGYAEMFRIQADRFRRGFDDRIEEDEL